MNIIPETTKNKVKHDCKYRSKKYIGSYIKQTEKEQRNKEKSGRKDRKRDSVSVRVLNKQNRSNYWKIHLNLL